MSPKKVVLILYLELAEYTLACISALSEKCSVHVVSWPVNTEAPFKFRELENVHFYNRSKLKNDELFKLGESIEPNTIICCGWLDKGYVSLCKRFRKKIPIYLTFDNQWKGGVIQNLKTIIARQLFKKTFTHVWIPGNPQKSFALKLGFKSHQIRLGYYSADLELFRGESRTKMPKKMLFVGRYLHFKGVIELWQAFIKFNDTTDSNWELHCAGFGNLWESRAEHSKIFHHGFLQPEELKKLISECSIFILPSHKEPWGVVVHEMSASGLVLLLSDKIGAASAFLKESENGLTFKSNNTDSLLDSLKTISAFTEADLIKMSKKSQQLAEGISPNKWAETITNEL